MDMYGWIVLICVFTAAFGLECPDGWYDEPRKGCKECSKICVNNPLSEDCSHNCPNWSPVSAAQKDPLPIADQPDGSETPDASPTNLQVIIPIAGLFVLVSILVGSGGLIYLYRTKWNPPRRVRPNANLPDLRPNNAIPPIEMGPLQTPEVIVHPGDTTGGNDDNPDAKQAVIVEYEDRRDDTGAAALEGPGGSDGETSTTGSCHSLYPLMEQPSQDANLDEPDYSSSTFCTSKSSAGLTQLIMNKMANTDLRNLGGSNSQGNDRVSTTDLKYASGPAMDSQPAHDAVDLPPEEFKGTGKYSGGARPKETKVPTQAKDSPKVTSDREPGGRRNKLSVSSQESPDQTLSETSAISQPVSEGDPTGKYYLGDPSSAEPYLTQAYTNLQQPAAPGRIPNGVNTYHHHNVNALFGGVSQQPLREPNDQRRPSRDEPPQL